MPHFLNLLQLTKAETEILEAILNDPSSNQGCSTWRKDTVYTMNGNEYRFSHNILRRSQAPKKDRKSEYRYEFLPDSPYSYNGKRATFFSVANIGIRRDKTSASKELGFFIRRKSHVVKKYAYEYMEEVKAHKEKLEKLSLSLKHLKMKPLFVEEHPKDGLLLYSVMKYMSGENVGEILAKDRLNPMGTEERIKYSLAILKAYKIQFADHGYIHFDIHGNNLKIDPTRDPVDVNIFDVDTVEEEKTAAGSDKTRPGTCDYVAPERLGSDSEHKSSDIRPMTQKVDIFALGVLISELWYNQEILKRRRTTNPIRRVQYAEEAAFNMPLDQLFIGLSVSEKVQIAVTNAIRGMVRANPDERSNIMDAITEFEQILINHRKADGRLTILNSP